MKVMLLISLFFICTISVANASEFWSLKFDAWVGEPAIVTVGKTINLPVYVKNNGLLEDTYDVNVTVVGSSQNVIIENPSFVIGPVKYGEVKSLSSKITLLVAEDAGIDIKVKSTAYSSAVWSKTTTIKSGLASLPDFDFLGIVQMMILVSILFLISKKL
jgi:hypothetical protein